MKWRNFFYVLLAISPLALCPLAQWLSVAESGTSLLLWLELYLYGFAVLAVLVAVPLYLTRLVLNRNPQLAAFVLLLSALFVPSLMYGILLGRHVRMEGMRHFAQRNNPIISAIYEFEKENQGPPKSLDDLVPKYLDEIPTTGMAAYPEYEYHTGQEARDQYQDNPWALSVFTPSGGINFDMMLYLPRQNYPERGYGGSLERIGDWAYVHE